MTLSEAEKTDRILNLDLLSIGHKQQQLLLEFERLKIEKKNQDEELLQLRKQVRELQVMNRQMGKKIEKDDNNLENSKKITKIVSNKLKQVGEPTEWIEVIEELIGEIDGHIESLKSLN